MGYPSLLYYVKPKKKPMSLSVFEDLQLLNFMPKRVARAACIPCERENILPRQELFKALTDSAARSTFRELYEISSELYRLDEAFGSVRTEAEKCLIFFFICGELVSFTEKASGSSLSDPISSRFALSFEKERSKEVYIRLKSRVNELSPRVEEALTVSLELSGENVRVFSETGVTFMQRIRACASTLGINEPNVKAPEGRVLSPDIVNSMGRLRVELMRELKAFKGEFSAYYSPSVTFYRKETEFYLTLLDLLDRIREVGIPLTYPTVADGRLVNITEAYDVSLLAKNETDIVPNDISFTEEEPFYILTGANGGGKTTYLRTVGIALVLFLLGCPVPCKGASIGDISSVFTHFPRDERFDGSGRFVEENNRVQAILREMDGSSVVLLNETYSTTNEENAVKMTEKLANELYGKGIFGLYITHQHGLSESKIPYLNVLIDVNDENRRTFKIAKQKSVGGSYARDILIRCGLTVEALEARFGKLGEEDTGI